MRHIKMADCTLSVAAENKTNGYETLFIDTRSIIACDAGPDA